MLCSVQLLWLTEVIQVALSFWAYVSALLQTQHEDPES